MTTTLPFAGDLLERSRQTEKVAVRVRPTGFWEGGIQSARRVPAAICPEAAGTQRADRGGVSVIPRSGRHRGAPARDALLGRGRGSLGAQRAGASKRREAAHLPGKKKPLRSDREKPPQGNTRNGNWSLWNELWGSWGQRPRVE